MPSPTRVPPHILPALGRGDTPGTVTEDAAALTSSVGNSTKDTIHLDCAPGTGALLGFVHQSPSPNTNGADTPACPPAHLAAQRWSLAAGGWRGGTQTSGSGRSVPAILTLANCQRCHAGGPQPVREVLQPGWVAEASPATCLTRSPSPENGDNIIHERSIGRAWPGTWLEVVSAESSPLCTLREVTRES